MGKLFQKIVVVGLLCAGLTACMTARNIDAPITSAESASVVAAPQFSKVQGTPSSVAASTLLGSALGKAVAKSLGAGDLAYYKEASQDALENTQTGKTSTWKNPNSGTYGTFTLIRVYETGGKSCREYTQTINIGGRTEEGYGKACRQEGGTWKSV